MLFITQFNQIIKLPTSCSKVSVVSGCWKVGVHSSGGLLGVQVGRGDPWVKMKHRDGGECYMDTRCSDFYAYLCTFMLHPLDAPSFCSEEIGPLTTHFLIR